MGSSHRTLREVVSDEIRQVTAIYGDSLQRLVIAGYLAKGG